MNRIIQADRVTVETLVQGYPGKTVCHGGLGWSTVALIRFTGHNVLLDVGSFGMRHTIRQHLAQRGLSVEDITDVVLSHSHYDHSVNWCTFPRARIHISGVELDWATQQPVGQTIVPEFYMRELAACPRLVRAEPGKQVVHGLTAHATPGHTPGHMVYVLETERFDVVFTGDAAKNRAELLCRRAGLTMDAAQSTDSIDQIWALWRRRANSVLVPGHDVPMVIHNGEPRYIWEREGGILAMFEDSIEQTRLFDLTATGVS
jgi:glyoxylase-like metal-dependent hydrolase (beta-lactamase superfamily II)